MTTIPAPRRSLEDDPVIDWPEDAPVVTWWVAKPPPSLRSVAGRALGRLISRVAAAVRAVAGEWRRSGRL